MWRNKDEIENFGISFKKRKKKILISRKNQSENISWLGNKSTWNKQRK